MTDAKLEHSLLNDRHMRLQKEAWVPPRKILVTDNLYFEERHVIPSLKWTYLDCEALTRTRIQINPAQFDSAKLQRHTHISQKLAGS